MPISRRFTRRNHPGHPRCSGKSGERAAGADLSTVATLLVPRSPTPDVGGRVGLARSTTLSATCSSERSRSPLDRRSDRAACITWAHQYQPSLRRVPPTRCRERPSTFSYRGRRGARRADDDPRGRAVGSFGSGLVLRPGDDANVAPQRSTASRSSTDLKTSQEMSNKSGSSRVSIT